MFQTLSKKLRNRKGFTLIELIVVLAILGIILAIAVPNYLGVQDSAAVNADEATLELVESGIKIWASTTSGDESGSYSLAFSGATNDDQIINLGTGTDDLDYTISGAMEAVAAPTSGVYSAADYILVTITTTDVTAQYYDVETTSVLTNP